MNRKLTLIVCCGLLASAAGITAWQAGYFSQPEQSAQLAPVAGDLEGNAIVRSAAAQMRRSPPLEATIRQEVEAYGERIQAPGRYLQQGFGQGGLRFELKPAISNDVGSFVKVSDGRFLYTRTTLMGQTSLTRLDLQTINRDIDSRWGNGTAGGFEQDWMFGGLAYLLERLDDDFAFAKPEPMMLGDVPVWRLRGTWKQSAFVRMATIYFGAPPAEPYNLVSQLPPQIPTHVELMIAREGAATGFPYQIRYLRPGDPHPAGAERPQESVLMSFECLQLVWNAVIDDRLFIYDPGDEEIVYVDEDFRATFHDRYPEVTPDPSEPAEVSTTLQGDLR